MDAGNCIQGHFLGPSPSANLVGNGKGDPLEPAFRGASTVAPTQPHVRVRGNTAEIAMLFGDLT